LNLINSSIFHTDNPSLDEQQDWIANLKKLVEETYFTNQNQSVTFISHSFGAPMMMVFLRSQLYIWKQKYISRMISLSGVYAGMAKSLKIYANGEDNYGHSGWVLRPAQISYPSQAFLLPFPLVYKRDEVLVITKSRNYTRGQYKDFFKDLGYPTGYEHLRNNRKHIDYFSPPEVEIHCLFGSQIDTIEA
jgi:lysophospholipase III